jgi:threonine dehydratase
MPTVTLDNIREARARIASQIRPTPLMQHPLLAAEMGCDVYVKHENHNPTGAFKVRGGLNLIGHLAETGDRTGVITASTGNHGQSIAYACRQHSIPCTVAVPVGNNPEKNAAMRAFGATLLEYGRDFDEARAEVERVGAAQGLRYVHSANEPHLIAGVGTYALETFEELAEIDYFFVPLGGGSGACGVSIVRSGLGRKSKVIGVQAERADAFARSWRGPVRVEGSSADTFAEGLATRVTFDLTFDILKKELDDMITLSEEELAEGVRLALRTTHNLAEGAGSASIAAAMKWRDRLRGKKVVCVMSGGNIDAAKLRRVLG